MSEMMTEAEKKECVELVNEYQDLLHAMQTGIKFVNQMQGDDSKEHKHLRVGINARSADMGGLVELLIEKGTFTEVEYRRKLVKYMKKEVVSYQNEIHDKYGMDIGLI